MDPLYSSDTSGNGPEIDLDRAMMPELTSSTSLTNVETSNSNIEVIHSALYDPEVPTSFQYPPVSEITAQESGGQRQLEEPFKMSTNSVQPMSFQSITVDPDEPLPQGYALNNVEQAHAEGGTSVVGDFQQQQQQHEILQRRRLTSNKLSLDEMSSSRRVLATDSKTSTEYTLHILFTQFVRHAERKLNMCLTYPLDAEPPIVDLLGEGVDQDFDKIIASLGYISRNNPKPVIDSVMFWRKSKSEVASMAAEAAEKAIQILSDHKEAASYRKHSHSASTASRFSHRRNTSSKTAMHPDSKSAYLESQAQTARETAVQGDRKSLISIYILCRVLIEIVKQVNFDTIGDDLGDKLEEIVFSQLRSTDPILISSSIIRSANWNLFAELLGCMSEKRFLSVSDRFIADLEKVPPVAPKEMEPSIHLLIHGMRYLKLKNYPLEYFEESADFLQSIAKFFTRSKSHSIRVAYAQVLSKILLPVAESVTAEVNHPTWSEAMLTIYKACGSIDVNDKNWMTNLTLATSVLCVSPSELFLNNWYGIVESCIKQLKGKGVTLDEKVTLSTCIARLLWVYIFRCTETLNNTTRKIEAIMKSMFLGKGRQTWMVTDATLIMVLVQIFRSIGYASLNPTVENFIIPMIKSAFNGHNLENVQHEKVILAVKSYIAILGDEERPLFPENPELMEKPDINLNVKTSNHEEISRYAEIFLFQLDSAVGYDEKRTQNSPSNSFYYSAKSPFSSFRFGNDFSLQTTKNLNLQTLAVVIESYPWLIHGAPNKTVELLCRNSCHDDYRVATASATALKTLASKDKLHGLISTFAKFAFKFSDRPNQSRGYVISKDLLRLYLEMLEHWLNSFGKKGKDKTESFGPGAKVTEEMPVNELELKNTITVIEEVEGHGLFFLSSHDFEIRRLALSILKIVESFDQALYDKTQVSKPKKNHMRSNSKFAADVGTRVIFILQSVDFFKIISSQRQHLSVAERSRLSKLSQRTRRDVLIKLAESDYGVDSALWFRVFPKLLNTIFEKCPITMALCRSIVCTRLVQMYEDIFQISDSSKATLSSASYPPEALVEQWKLYLIVACASLTSTSEQRIHIPDGPANGKKKSHQLLTIQQGTITSARSVFRLTLNLLNSSNQFVRDAIITGLSCMNINIFQTFIEAVEPIFAEWEKDIPSKDVSKNSRLRIEVTHVLNLISHFLDEDAIIKDDWIVERLISFLRIILAFLSKPDVQFSFEFQKLRRYFSGLLENSYNGIRKRDDHETLFPFEVRLANFAFLEEWCGYGKSSVVAKQRYLHMSKYSSNSQELTALNSAIEFEKQILTLSALNAMVSLLKGKIEEVRDQTVLKFDLHGLLSWVDILLDSSNDRNLAIAKKALNNMFANNATNVVLLNEVYKRCILEHKMAVIENYYVALADALVQCEELPLKKHQVLLLILYGIGFSDHEIRCAALRLMVSAEKRLFDAEFVSTFSERVRNRNKTIYKRALLDISTYLSSTYPEMNINLISELTKYFKVINFESRRDLLTILLPWLQTVELHVGEDLSVDTKSFMVLNNLLDITITFSESIPNEIEALWISLGNGGNFNNSTAILKFCINTSLSKRNPLFVEFASKVLVYLAPSFPVLVDHLISYIDHKYMVPPQPSSPQATVDSTELPYVADIWRTLHYTGKDSVFSLGQLALIFLSDLLLVPKESTTAKIPLLLHASFVLLDHYLPIVQESANKTIINILGNVPSHPKVEETKEMIRNNQKYLWTYDDLNSDKNGARSPKDMDLLIRNILEIFSTTLPSMQKDWGMVALLWATNCAVRHIACRSFQVFRSLLSFLDQSMLKDMLQRLSNTISDSTHEIQGFAMQILMTLNAITSELDAEKLIDFPQLFWATAASLHTVNENEYVELLSVLNKFLSKIDLDSEDTVQCLVSTFPSNWEGKFEGLQQIVMIGLRSSVAWDASLQLLSKLNKLKDSDIIADDSRLLFALLTNTPRYLHSFDDGAMSSEILESSEVLELMATNKGETNLARIINSFGKHKFRTKDEFLRQVVKFISDRYLMDYSGQIVIFLLGLLSNKMDWVKKETMRTLKLLFPKVDLTAPHFQGCGADLISPLLRLLLTPYAEQALEVLDETTSISGSKLDKDILRMSLGNKAIRKDYEKTATLFGIPEESGWSIPMPAVTAATTRNNVHAVLSTCIAPVETETSTDEHEQIKFHMDDYYSSATQGEKSVAEENDDSLSHMWAELDNLDSFFTKDAESSSQFSGTTDNTGGNHFRSISVDTRDSNNDQLTPYESAPQIYDKKVSLILNRSLARTKSNTSFKISLADSFTNFDNRHLNSVNTRVYPRSKVTSPIGTSSRATSPSTPLTDQDLFRFEGILGKERSKSPAATVPLASSSSSASSPAQRDPLQPKPRKKTGRFTPQSEYLPHLSHWSYSSPMSPSHGRQSLKEKSSTFSLNRDKKMFHPGP